MDNNSKKKHPLTPLEKLKRKYDFNDTDIAEMFGYKNRVSYANSSAKPRLETAILRLYKLFSVKK